MNPDVASPLVFTLLHIAAGLALVLAGRRLFWVFVGVIGFLLGFQVGNTFFADSPMTLLLALAVGVVAALLALGLQKIAIILGGAAAGWLLGMQLAVALGLGDPWGVVLGVVTAVIFGLLILMIFEIALIAISSLVGASLMLEPFPLAATLWLILWIAITAVGIIVQLRLRPATTAPARV